MTPGTLEQLFAWSLAQFPRVAKLRRAVLDARPAIALRRSERLVQYYEQEGFDVRQPVLRQARALGHILEGLPVEVFDDELLVGSSTEHRLGCAVYPEFHSGAIWPELASLSRRQPDPVEVSAEAEEKLGLWIFPYFAERNIHDWTRARAPQSRALALMERWSFFLVSLANGVSHVLPDYAQVVTRGLRAIGTEARERRVQLGPGADPRTAEFLEAVELATRAVITFAERHAERCAQLACQTSDPARRAELEQLAAMLRHVPAEPARTFHEGLQAVWLTHVALLQENSDLAINFGRLDQYLGPLLDADLAAGRLDLGRALELAMCLYVKSNDHTPLVPGAARKLFGGSATDQSVTLGGVRPDGADGTQLASYVFLRALDLLRLREPNVDARFHPDAPAQWRERVLQVVQQTGAAPALYNDEAIVCALTAKGAQLEHARDYGVIGCVEPAVCGRTYGSTGAILLNVAAALELALWDGRHPHSGEQIGPRTGALREHASFETLWGAFVKQLRFLVAQSVEVEHLQEAAHAELHPVPLLSALVEGPLEQGRDLTAGSARYNISGVWALGLADVADSLSAVRSLVFEQGRIDLAALERALARNFEGAAALRAMCRERAPRYGNDDAAADQQLVRVVEAVDDAYAEHRNARGGPYHVGYWTMTLHTAYGELVGALPNGRLRGAPLASGATPVNGAARRGPSASLSSTARLPPARIANGIANNHKLSATQLSRPGRMNTLNQLVRGFFDAGGMQLQFVVADRAQLLRAMDDPELARELLVRVSGYTAYFGDLDRQMQQEIIDRTEDAL
jgi:pyruvate formate-lyase/glycerol dehydratase family glycyl radical enzyme